MEGIFLANLVRYLHIFLVIFLVIAPLSNNALVILLNLVLMFGIMIHWILNDQTCCLTVLEKMLRGKELDSETFFGNLMGPIYSANSNTFSWIFILVLFVYNCKRLYEERHQLKEIYEIIIPSKK
jgi:hypothetical protein